jgi:hypothetical protein
MPHDHPDHDPDQLTRPGVGRAPTEEAIAQELADAAKKEWKRGQDAKPNKKLIAKARGEFREKKIRIIDTFAPDEEDGTPGEMIVPPQELTRHAEICPETITAFLAVVAVSGRPTQAASKLQMNYMKLRELYKDDDVFRERWDLSMKAAFEHQEDEVRRRAFDGYQRPIYQMGKLVGHETVYSDALAMTMLKAGKPDTYNPKTVQTIEHAGHVGVTVAQMTDEELNEAINRKLRFLGVLPQQVTQQVSDVEAKEVVQLPPVNGTGEFD